MTSNSTGIESTTTSNVDVQASTAMEPPMISGGFLSRSDT